MQLFDSPFSPFARKVRMILQYKGLAFEAIDALRSTNHAQLQAVNGRVEVPTLVDGDTIVVNSADIVCYLEHRYPAQPVYPASPPTRVHARAWERAADSLVDPILVDISYWRWAHRSDTMPVGLLEAARADLARIYESLEAELAQRPFVSTDNAPSIADFTLFPHLASVHALDVGYSRERHSGIARWFKRMRALPVCSADLQRTRDYVANIANSDIERNKIFWRGDRIEWMLARGFHEWFVGEIRAQRVIWPGMALPAPLTRLLHSAS